MLKDGQATGVEKPSKYLIQQETLHVMLQYHPPKQVIGVANHTPTEFEACIQKRESIPGTINLVKGSWPGRPEALGRNILLLLLAKWICCQMVIEIFMIIKFSLF